MTAVTRCAHVTVWRPDAPNRSATAGLVDVHLRVEVDGTGPLSGCAERADVICISATERPVGLAADTVDRLLEQFPGCLVAVTPTTGGGCVAGARDGTRVVAEPEGVPRRRITARERASLASYLHGQLVVNRPWTGRNDRVLVLDAYSQTGAGRRLSLRLASLAIDHSEE